MGGWGWGEKGGGGVRRVYQSGDIFIIMVHRQNV